MKHPIALVLAAIAWFLALPAATAEPVLHHVHGLAFTPDGKSLVVPAHIGLAVYRDGRWSTAPGAPHDFMGFSVARHAMYSSGHPAPGTPLRNPLGLMKSTDGGKTWQQLGLAGESDFHVMTAGYASGAIYVVNPEPNSRMRDTGLHVTLDEGKSWKRGGASGLSGQVISLAAHPTAAGTVAAGTTNGLYISRDHGSTFKRLGAAAAVTAVMFDLDGKHVYFATEPADKLHRVALDGARPTAVPLPALGRDFVLYIAQNAVNVQELAIATRRRDVYVSRNSGTSWQQIARAGEDMKAASKEGSPLRKAGSR
ncbi:MAG TPA: glycosyl hydrolase [Burkholderiales bacterium]|nr:glycosyl hydrolase [Burkholderiales bacterium]